MIIINFANPDMVGHTGVEAAAIKAIEAVDECVGKAVEAIKEVDGQMFICADHGNAEQLIDYETGEPFTAHTTNPVPFILVNADPGLQSERGRLPGRHRTDPDRTHGNGAAQRNDRKIPSDQKIIVKIETGLLQLQESCCIIYLRRWPEASSGCPRLKIKR